MHDFSFGTKDTTDFVAQTIDTFWDTMPSVWHGIHAYIDKEAREWFDITGDQFHILRRVSKGIDSVSDLAAAKHISKPSISRTVDALVDRGLMNRAQDPKDRRQIRLSLTPEGEILLQTVFSSVRTWMAVKLGNLEAGELINIREALAALRKAFQ